MLRPIESTRSAVALNLLCDGFPWRSRAYWERIFQQLEHFGGNAGAGVPYGQILEVSGKPAGVILTPASLRGHRRVINFASWYVVPEHRWKAPLMLRALMREKEAVYTDLTPTEPVQKMLGVMGFTALSRGIALSFAPLLAVTGGRGGEVGPLAAAEAGAVDPDVARLLASHEEFGCHAAVLRTCRGSTPLLFKFRQVSGVPAAVLLYSGDDAALRLGLGAAARYLVSRGRPVLVLDLPLSGNAPGFARPGKTPRFMKGPMFAAGRTDYCGSELALF